MQAAAEAARSQPPLEPPAANPPQLPGTAGFAHLDALELESLALNLDTSLRVHATHHFFNWTQGSLQNLVRHELLICALRKSEPAALHFESFTTAPFDLARFNEMLRQDSALLPHVVKTWEENHRKPLFYDTRDGSPHAASALARELNRIEATTLIGHGTYDAYAKLTSFFVFACRPGATLQKQAYLVELAVPFLHAAWVRTQINGLADGAGARPAAAGTLTAREIEILKWLYHGKSNVEIGMILGISPLTVKNHVQKILRKLNVLNRTQAVGKALASRILNV
jgi:transcriptional regulator EpsA